MLRIVKYLTGGLILICLSYIAVLGYTYWQYEVPHHPYPDGYEQAGEEVLIDERYQKLADQISELLEATTLEKSAPSISAAFSINNQLIWSGAKGYADFENQIEANTKSRYRAGSVSKSLTTLAVARLLDQQKVNLDQSVTELIPGLPEFYQPVTMRLLAQHTAGVRHYKFDLLMWPPNDFFSDEKYESVDAALEIFKSDPLVFEPGSQYQYSSYGYNLLSAAVEGSVDEPFLQTVQTQVFDPLQLKDIVPDHFDAVDPNRVAFYVTGPGEYGLAYPVDLSIKWAGGGFLSTPTDLVKVGIAATGPGFISESTYAELFTPSPQSVEKGADYGLGWAVKRLAFAKAGLANVLSHNHSGGSVGGLTFLLVLPEHEVVVAVQTNTSSREGGPSPRNIAHAIADLILVSLKENQD